MQLDLGCPTSDFLLVSNSHRIHVYFSLSCYSKKNAFGQKSGPLRQTHTPLNGYPRWFFSQNWITSSLGQTKNELDQVNRFFRYFVYKHTPADTQTYTASIRGHSKSKQPRKDGVGGQKWFPYINYKSGFIIYGLNQSACVHIHQMYKITCRAIK